MTEVDLDTGADLVVPVTVDVVDAAKESKDVNTLVGVAKELVGVVTIAGVARDVVSVEGMDVTTDVGVATDDTLPLVEAGTGAVVPDVVGGASILVGGAF